MRAITAVRADLLTIGELSQLNRLFCLLQTLVL
jgi:hypothetical protein